MSEKQCISRFGVRGSGTLGLVRFWHVGILGLGSGSLEYGFMGGGLGLGVRV